MRKWSLALRKKLRMLGILLVVAFMVCVPSGCGASTSFEEEYTQEEFNEQADEVADEVTEEVDEAAEAVEEQDEEIKEQAKKTSDRLKERAENDFERGMNSIDEWSNTGMSTDELGWYYTLKFYYFLKEISPALIAISWFAAIILYFISKGNKRKQQAAVFGFGITVPVILLFIRYGVPWLMMLF